MDLELLGWIILAIFMVSCWVWILYIKAIKPYLEERKAAQEARLWYSSAYPMNNLDGRGR